MKLLVAGGGTGGHVSPGLAVAAAWQKMHGEGTVLWAGRSEGIEARMAAEAGVAFRAVEARPLKRSLDPKNLLLPLSLIKGLRQAWALLKEEKPSVCLLTGGYVSVPVALAAILAGFPLVLIEPNAVLGLANRFFSGAADAVCLAYPLKPAPRHAVLTGNPVRFSSRLPSRDAGLKQFGLDGRHPVLLVLPGSGAAHSINVALSGALKALKGVQMIWMTGAADYEAMQAAAKKAGMKGQVLAFVDDVKAAYAAADLVLARCGASLLAEIALAGKASLLLPYPYATGDHQRLNALGFVEAGAASMMMDSELSGERLGSEISGLLSDAPRLKRMGAAARKLGRPDAAENVAGVLQRVAKGYRYV